MHNSSSVAVWATIAAGISALAAFFTLLWSRAMSRAAIGIVGTKVGLPRFEVDPNNSGKLMKVFYNFEFTLKNKGKVMGKIVEERLGCIQVQKLAWKKAGLKTAFTFILPEEPCVYRNELSFDYPEGISIDDFKRDPHKFIGDCVMILLLRYRSKQSIFTLKSIQGYEFTGGAALHFLKLNTYEQVKKKIPREFRLS